MLDRPSGRGAGRRDPASTPGPNALISTPEVEAIVLETFADHLDMRPVPDVEVGDEGLQDVEEIIDSVIPRNDPGIAY